MKFHITRTAALAVLCCVLAAFPVLAEPAEEPKEEAVEEAAESVADEVIEEVAEEIVKETIEETVEEFVEDSNIVVPAVNFYDATEPVVEETPEEVETVEEITEEPTTEQLNLFGEE